MSALDDKVGCFIWETDDCGYSIKKVDHIDFDVEWEGCDGLWMAPIWTFSPPWSPVTNKQGLSGEVDFVEMCPKPSVATNLGCYDAGQGDGCKDGGVVGNRWGKGTGSNGKKHMQMTDSGDLIAKVDGKGVASYDNYLKTVYPTTDGRDNAYKFISDIFNDARGPRGDGGWDGCLGERNPLTNCKYAVTNIKITGKNGIAVFGENSQAKCKVMNA